MLPDRLAVRFAKDVEARNHDTLDKTPTLGRAGVQFDRADECHETLARHDHLAAAETVGLVARFPSQGRGEAGQGHGQVAEAFGGGQVTYATGLEDTHVPTVDRAVTVDVDAGFPLPCSRPFVVGRGRAGGSGGRTAGGPGEEVLRESQFQHPPAEKGEFLIVSRFSVVEGLVGEDLCGEWVREGGSTAGDANTGEGGLDRAGVEGVTQRLR